METGTSLKIEYWGVTEFENGKQVFDDFEGINEFRKDLADKYISAVHGRPGERGGVLPQLEMECSAV